MKLSERANEYLNKLNRDWNWYTDIETTKEYLRKNNIEQTVEILNFQDKYSGLELVIKNDLFDSFSASLFSKKQISDNEFLDIDKIGNRNIFNCGNHKTAQINFYLTDEGEFCTINEDDSLNILNSSFDKVIEIYALKNEIYNWKQSPYYYEIENYDKLVNLMHSNFELMHECSDQFHSFWTDKELIIEKGIWLDRHEFYLHIFGKSEINCSLFLNKMKSEKIVK